MVDAIVSIAIEKLSDFLIQEAAFLFGVKDDVESMRDELGWMHSFLKDAEQKQDTDHRIRTWISEISSIASKVEVIIDKYSAENKGTGPSKSKLLKCFYISNKANYDIGKEIKQLKERLLGVSSKRQVYGISDLGNTELSASDNAALRDLRKTSPRADQEHFVGFDDDVQLLETQLLSLEPRRSVISIWGMGGLGKTALSKKLYKNTQSWFALQAWVYVSQEWNTRDLLKRIIKSFQGPTLDVLTLLEKMDDLDMEGYLCDLLKESRYLVVIDDVWNKEAWECLSRSLPDNHNGSRIIITTRNEDVAGLSDKRTYVHPLRFLRPDESWDLFCKKAFEDSNSACPVDMEEIGKQMVEKCGGLPLGIIVLGGLLSRKKPYEWHIIKKSIWNRLKEKSIHIAALLDLSYNDLSHVLKQCFMYFSLFPEDYEIRSRRLVELWVAEDFITPEGGLDLEESGDIYFKELSGRSLIHVVKKNNPLQLDEEECSIHDLLRDLIVNKAKCRDFLHIYDETSSKAFSSKCIAIRSGFESYKSHDKSHHQVRTLSFLGYRGLLDEGSTRKILKLIKTQFTSLKVLDLVALEIKTAGCKLELFEATEKLTQLRYLGLNFGPSDDITQFPESIGKLQALQVLEVNGGRVLLRDIYKLKKLRHLHGRFVTKRGDEIIVPSTFLERLTNLQTLDRINIDGLLRDEKVGVLALNAFSKLCNLKVLHVDWSLPKHKLSVEPLFSCVNLVQLTLNGSLRNLPAEPHEFLPKLKYLELQDSELEHDPIPMLEKLRNLEFISLFNINTNEVKCMIFGATGFPKLETLRLDASEDMKLQVEEGTMPRLSCIFENDFTKKNIPEKLRHLLTT